MKPSPGTSMEHSVSNMESRSDYGRNCKIKGRSGVYHQIDVLTEQLGGEQYLLTAIECKYWNKKVNKDIVMKLSKIMEGFGYCERDHCL